MTPSSPSSCANGASRGGSAAGRRSGRCSSSSSSRSCPSRSGRTSTCSARLGPAILWIAALLSTLLGLDRLFQSDADDGSLDGLINAALPLELIVLVKCAAHWTASALPLIVVSPLFGLMLAMNAPTLALVALTPAGRHAGADDDRRHRRGAHGLAAPRRAPDGGAGAAADHPGAHLRRRRGLGGQRRRYRRSCTPFLMLCAMTLFAIAGAPVRGGGGVAACEGVRRLPTRPRHSRSDFRYDLGRSTLFPDLAFSSQYQIEFFP